MNKRISQLIPEVTAPMPDDPLPIVNGGVTGKIKVSNLVTKQAAGLGNVDNTSDANKPVSNATQIAINNAAQSASDDAIAFALALGGS